jgi:hypothetical protein
MPRRRKDFAPTEVVALSPSDVGFAKKFDPTADLHEIIPDSEVSAPKHEESSRSLSMMRRAAMAIVDGQVKDPAHFSLQKVLAKAEIPMEMFWQMAESVDFWPLLDWATVTSQVGRYVGTVMKMTSDSLDGNASARKSFMDIVQRYKTANEDEFRRAYQTLDDQGFQKVLDETMRSIDALRKEFAGRPTDAEEALRDEARNGVLSIDTPPPMSEMVLHADIQNAPIPDDAEDYRVLSESETARFDFD